MDPSNHIKQRGLTGAIGANQTGDRSLGDLQTGTIHSMKTAEMLMEVFNFDQGFVLSRQGIRVCSILSS